MTFSKIGIDGTLIEQADSRTGKNIFVFTPTLDETGNTIPVNLYKASRSQHALVQGLSGTGKSAFLENLCADDGKQGTGFCVIDAHGSLVNNVIARILKDKPDRINDTILVDIEDFEYFVPGFNLFFCSNPKSVSAVQETTDRVMHIFEMLLGVTPETPLIRQYLRHCTYTLIANPGYTMAEIPLLLDDKHFRQQLVANVTDPNVQRFWKRYDGMKSVEEAEQSAAIIRRIEEFLLPLILPIVGQERSTIDFRQVMDEQKILLVKLDSIRYPVVSRLIGALIISLFFNAASSRTKKKLFNIYADEFSTYASEDFVNLIDQARKKNIGLLMALQKLSQLEDLEHGLASKVRKGVLSASQKIYFRLSSEEAERAKDEFMPALKPSDMEYRPIYDPQYVTKWEWDSEENKNEYELLGQRLTILYAVVKELRKLFIEGGMYDNSLETYSYNSYQEIGQVQRFLNDYQYDENIRERRFRLFLPHNFYELEKKRREELEQELDKRRVFTQQWLDLRHKETQEEYQDIWEKWCEVLFFPLAAIRRKKRVKQYRKQVEEIKEQEKQFVKEFMERLPETRAISYPVGRKTQAERTLQRSIIGYPDNSVEKEAAILLLHMLQTPKKLSNGSVYPGIQEAVKSTILTTEFRGYFDENYPDRSRLFCLYYQSSPLPELKTFFLEILKEIEENFGLIEQQKKKFLAEHFIEVKLPKVYMTSDDELHSPVFRPAYERDFKISHSYSYMGSRGFRRDEAVNTGYSVSEERTQLYEQKPGRPEPLDNAWNRIQAELTNMPNYVARVKILVPSEANKDEYNSPRNSDKKRSDCKV